MLPRRENDPRKLTWRAQKKSEIARGVSRFMSLAVKRYGGGKKRRQMSRMTAGLKNVTRDFWRANKLWNTERGCLRKWFSCQSLSRFEASCL